MGKTAIFNIEGGIGKHIAATAVIECYKNNHPKTDVVVVCAWPEVFLGNKFVKRVYRAGTTPYFYRDYILNKEVEVFAQDPYKTTSHITKKKHLIESWCDLVGITYSRETPKIFFNFREKEISSQVIQNNSGKPLLLFQPFGGPGKDQQQLPYSWTRDIHPDIAQILVNKLAEKYFIVHICYDHHPKLDNVMRLDQIMLKKVLFGLINQSQARLFVDSSLQHAAAAMGVPSTVVWVATQPSVFGYNIHNNVSPKMQFLEGTPDSFLHDFNFNGPIHECPYDSPDQIFDIEKILEKF